MGILRLIPILEKRTYLGKVVKNNFYGIHYAEKERKGVVGCACKHVKVFNRRSILFLLFG